ncbi:MAG: branched-chain amino acid ABC transporter permease, partial [Candidatus Bathyarchaeia archaeon]
MAFKTRLYWYALLGIIIFLGLIPFLAQQFWIVVLSLVFVYIACSEMWSFLAGHAGLLVLGQQAFLGLGVYTQLIVSEILKWPPWVGVILSPFAGASAAALVSLSVKRLRGFFFAFSTLLISEILYNAFINWPLVGGAWGKRMEVARFVPSIVIYYFSAFIAIIACIIVYYIHNSKLGVGVRAVGCDEEAAAELGVNVFRCKAICLILAGAITALA